MQRFLHALADGQGFDAACLSTGLNRGDVLLARARNPGLAELWDQVGEARRAAMESMLLDRGEAALRAPPLDVAEGGLGFDKPTAGLLQWALGAPRAPRTARPAEPKPAPTKAAPAPEAAVPPEPTDEETAAILAEALARLAAAEAALGSAADEADGPPGREGTARP